MLVPPDGWHFLQTHNDKQQRVDADSIEELYMAVLMFRLTNGIPPGAVQQDVDDQICNRAPRACITYGQLESTAHQAPHPSAVNRWIDQVLIWLHQQRQQPAQLVDSAEAQQRMNRCNQCPFNQPMTSGCSKCDVNIKELSFFVRQGRKLVNEEGMGCCKRLNIDLKAAMWLPKDRMPKQENLPEICPYR